MRIGTSSCLRDIGKAHPSATGMRTCDRLKTGGKCGVIALENRAFGKRRHYIPESGCYRSERFWAPHVQKSDNFTPRSFTEARMFATACHIS